MILSDLAKYLMSRSIAWFENLKVWFLICIQVTMVISCKISKIKSEILIEKS